MRIRYFEIKGLFGEVDIAIPIRDNKLVLVGYNGIGKSTVLNVFYYLLSRQWKKLLAQDFYSVCICLNNRDEIEILKSDVEIYIESQLDRRRISGRRRYSGKQFDQILTFIDREFPEPPQTRRHIPSNLTHRSDRYQAVESIASEFGISISAADEFYAYYVSRSLKNLPLFDASVSAIQEFEAAVDESIKGRILYLPTYRRIERDVKDVFPEFEDEMRKKLQSRRGRSRSETHIELVEFGMDDVNEKIRQRLENIRGYALSQVNSLTSRYLRDVIRDEASQFSSDTAKIDQITLNAVLEKVDDQTLTDSDKESLNGVVSKINAGVPLEENEKYIAHYVTYLSEVGLNIARLEASIREFARICNGYLFGKKFALDDKGYKLVIKRDSGRDVDLEQLSSGEKQIVSLFSHLLLEDGVDNYVIIDEPELSLSVDWQQNFLEDIAAMPSCKLIFAVTHSPFIYENSLDEYAVDLLECEVG